jgi:Uma2 family endonuclease
VVSRVTHARDAALEVITLPASALTTDGFERWRQSEFFPTYCDIAYRQGKLTISNWVENPKTIKIPASAVSVDGFTDWAISPAFPKRGRISYIDGEIVVDMSPEELSTHNPVKGETSRVVATIVKEDDLGIFYSDRTLVKNAAANLSNEPDASFISWESWQSGRVRIRPRRLKKGLVNYLYGSPDWALEVVSKTSVKKDTQWLWTKYYNAGVKEYWLVDARGDEIDFQILLRRRTLYVAAPSRGGWQRSEVFGRSFKLDRKRHPLGPWIYKLHFKPA